MSVFVRSTARWSFCERTAGRWFAAAYPASTRSAAKEALSGRSWLAAHQRDLAGRVEEKHDPNRLALEVQVVQHDAVGEWLDLLKPERRRHEAGELRLPVRPERRSTLDFNALAGARESGITGVAIEQRLHIMVPAGVEPIHHDSHRVEIVRQFHPRLSNCRAIPSEPRADRLTALNDG